MVRQPTKDEKNVPKDAWYYDSLNQALIVREMSSSQKKHRLPVMRHYQ